MRKIILVASIATIGALGLTAAGPAAANNASNCGANHGAFANENGNFGFLGGLHGTPYYENFNKTEPGVFTVGQEPGATGYNNKTSSEAVCAP
jgi:hypothetical protein